MKTNTNRIFKYLIEFLIVAFGVFLGMYASELQTKKKTKLEKKRSINYILEELESNKKSLEKSIDYHQLIKPRIDSIAKNLTDKDIFLTYLTNKKFQHYNIEGWTGFNQAELENTAFESAKISGIIAEYDIDLIGVISRMYKQQETYSQFGKTILNKMINIDSSTKVLDVIDIIQLMTTDLLNFEKHLLVEIGKLEKEINTTHNN